MDRVCEQLSEGESRQLLELAFGQDAAPSHDDARAAVAALRVGVLQRRLKEIQQKISEAEDEGEQERLLRDKLATAREIQALESGAAAESSRALTGGE